MFRWAVSCVLIFALGGCLVPGPLNVPDLVPEKAVRPDLRERISHRLLWFSPEESWHYNCLFLKPLRSLDYDEQRLALPSADLLFRAYHEERRLAYRSAGHLYRQAADQGIALAYVRLGNLLLDGKGTRANPQGGAKLVEQSARLDCAEGQYRYAELLTTGQGVRTDLVMAWAWADVARSQGYKAATDLQKKMQSVMAPAQVSLAEENAKTLRKQLDLFNRGPQSQILVECVTPRNQKPFITRMRACHAMGGRHMGKEIDYRTK